MSARSEESAVERLRKQAERAIAAAQGRRVVEPLLERIVSLAPDGSDASVFAHRHLAEYRIEDHPWRALLHLRKVVIVSPDDDVVHALMGLSHALLANFRAAVSSYRRALTLAPRNPWYHHNLGHLLDVALDQPGAALRHLELAHRAAHPPEHEIAASLAHCLARLGRLDEARETASAAVRAEPRNREHKQLLAWIERGAPEEGGDPRTRRASTAEAPNARVSSTPPRAASPARQATSSRQATSASTQSPSEARSSEARSSEARSSEPRQAPPLQAAPLPPAQPRQASARRAAPRSTAPRSTAPRDHAASSARPEGSMHDASARDGSARDASVRDAAVTRRRAPSRPERAPTTESSAGTADGDSVLPLVERVMRDGGFTPEHVARARRLWLDYRNSAPRATKPDVCAAAIEYAIARLHGLDGVTRASVARRYGVSARAVSERFDDIQVVLALKPDDPRYARC